MSSYKSIKDNDVSNVESKKRYQGGDIFYIVLDGYGGNEVLSEYINLDNTPFYKMLEEKGFAMSYNSRSNYPTTQHSIASTLNMSYLDSIGELYGEDFKNTEPLRNSIYNSQLFEILKQHQYNIVMITTSGHLNPKLGRNKKYYKGLINDFHALSAAQTYFMIVFQQTPLPLFIKLSFISNEFDADGKPWVPESIVSIFRKGLSFADNRKKDFVFMHVLCPHEPYYFDKNGNIAVENKELKWNDYEGPFEDYCLAYRGNLLGLNKIVEMFIDSLFILSDSIPIVILQGDHGPPEVMEVVLERENIDYTVFQTSILNAFHLPEMLNAEIEDGMTSVNTFRKILPFITGNEMELLENKSYYVNYIEPYKFRLLE